MPRIIKAIKGFPGYAIGNDGSLWSYWKTRGRKMGMGVESYISNSLKELKGRRRPDGYRSVSLQLDRSPYDFLVHRLVLEMFVGPQPEGMECCHRDGDKSNNQVSNLYWGTRTDNMADQIRHGVTTRGERNASAKLTADDVRKIVELLNNGVMQDDIAARYGVGQAAISLIARGKTWQYLTTGMLQSAANHWSKRPDADEIAAKIVSNRPQILTEEHRNKISAGGRRRWARYRQLKPISQ